MDIRQKLIIRTDLNMRKGKMVSQGGHASLKVFFDRICNIKPSQAFPGKYTIEIDDISDDELAWSQGSFTKICLGIKSEEEIKELYAAAKAKGIPCALIEDNGVTEFHGVKTITSCAIGPAHNNIVDPLTEGLSLL